MVLTLLEIFILGHYECMAHQVLQEYNSLTTAQTRDKWQNVQTGCHNIVVLSLSAHKPAEISPWTTAMQY